MQLTHRDKQVSLNTQTDAPGRLSVPTDDRCCPMSPAAELSALLARMATLARTTTGVSGAYAAPAGPLSDRIDDRSNDN